MAATLESLRNAFQSEDVAFKNRQLRLAFDEVARLRVALSEIICMHKGDQPAAMNVSDLEWADRHIMTMRLHAQAALK